MPDLVALQRSLEQLIAASKFGELIRAIVTLVARLRDLNLELTQRVAQLRRKRPQSETLERLERQLLLPLFVTTVASSAKPLEPKIKKKRSRPLESGRRPDFPDHLERVPVHNWLTPEQRRCPICGASMKTIAHALCERYNVIPARIVVEQRFDETVACPYDDTIVSAAAPAAIVERGVLGNELIVEATCDKFIEHLPIERQCLRWARTGAPISPATLGRAVATHLDLLLPIANAITEQTRAPGLLATDATGIPVLDPKSPDGIRNGTMWCWTNALWVSFFYSAKGDSDSVRRFLEDDLKRVAQCDGTSVTNCIEKAGGKRPGCWAHGRRRFAEATRSGDTLALHALHLIAPLFKIEEQSKLAGESAEQRKLRRLAQSKPVLEQIRNFVEEQRLVVPPKTPLGQALGYLYRQWHRLILFLEDGNIELTNNGRERELRKLVLGKKNWLFTWKDIGGERSAAILSIVATCVSHEVSPRAYLHVVTKLLLEDWPNAKLRDLLPDRIVSLYPELAAPSTLSRKPRPAVTPV
jgi:transposase